MYGADTNGSSSPVVGLPQKKRWRIEPRYQIVIVCFLATFTAYVERVGFSIAFTTLAQEAGLDEKTKGTVLSAFFWGYAVSQIYGGRIMLIISFFLWSIFSLITPTNARNVTAIITARVCIGVSQGFLIPSIHTVLSQWISPHERARAVSLTTSGMYLGSAASMWFLPAVSKAFGASSLLKVNGGLGLSWLVLWLVVGKEIPHRESVIPMTMNENGSGGQKAANKGRPSPTPVKRMMMSSAIVVKVDLASLGWMKTMPYLAMFLMSNVGGYMGDWLILRRKQPVGRARKTVNTLGFLSSAAALMLMPAASSVITGVLFTTLTLSALGFSRGGFSVNHMDIAPKYAGMVMGISNTAGTLAGVVGVAVTGYILDANGGADNLAGWWNAHATCAIICVCSMFVFNLFARGDRLFD
eukprot:gene7480-625_t